MGPFCSRLLLLVIAIGCAPAARTPAAQTAAPTPAGAVTSPLPPSSSSPPGASPLTLGETFQIASKVLGERRAINVYVPSGCGEAAARCPVLYMLDGGMDEDFL